MSISLELSRSRKDRLMPAQTYESPFDRLDFAMDYSKQSFRGTLNDVFTSLEIALETPRANISTVIYNPARILRGLMDYQVENPNSQDSLALIQQAVKLGLNTYQSPSTAIKKLPDIKQAIFGSDCNPALQRQFEQFHDPNSWYASVPKKSKQTVSRIVEETQAGDILFIPLGHGGVPVGMDVFLRYLAETGCLQSKLYPIRFSMYKHKDEEPWITPKEATYLKGLSVGRDIVVFDEDCATGLTLQQATLFLGREVFPHKQIIPVTNRPLGTF